MADNSSINSKNLEINENLLNTIHHVDSDFFRENSIESLIVNDVNSEEFQIQKKQYLDFMRDISQKSYGNSIDIDSSTMAIFLKAEYMYSS